MLRILFSFFILITFVSCNSSNSFKTSGPFGGTTGDPSAAGELPKMPPDSDKTIAAGCSKIALGPLFNSGEGTEASPYYICNEQQFLNISAVKFNSLLNVQSPGFFDFPYMGKSFILGSNLNFPASGVEFFTIGHLMASVGRSLMLSNDQKQSIANYDELNFTNFVSSLTQNRIPFNGSFNGNGYSIEVGDYYPTESRLIGLFGLGGPGISLKNLTIKNFNIYGYGTVNAGLLLGSLIETPVAKQWVNYSEPRSLKLSTIDNITVINSSLNEVVANSGSLIGAVRVYPGQEVRISNIKIENVKIDGSASTQLEPQYGDDMVTAIYNKMHNVGSLIGYVHSDGKANISKVSVKTSSIFLKNFYTGEGKVLDTSDANYIYSADLTDQTSYDINFIYDMLDTPDYDGNDPAWAISNFVGSLASLSTSANVSINDISVTNSSSYFLETAKGIGSLVGELAMLSGSLAFQNINLKNNKIELNNKSFSSPSWGIGNFAGAATFAGSGSNYSFRNISVDGAITANYASYSSDISGFFGHASTMDEIMTADNTIVFSDIFIDGSSTLMGSDVHSVAPFAGTFIGLGDLSGGSSGLNRFSMTNIYNDFKITMPGLDPWIIGGFIGFLGNGDYDIENVVVNADLQIFDPNNFYNHVNSVIGLNNSAPIVNNSYYANYRAEFVSGLTDPSNNFGHLTDESALGFASKLSNILWGYGDNNTPLLLVGKN